MRKQLFSTTITFAMAVLTGCHGNSGKESAGFMDFPVTEEAQWEYISSDEILPPYPFSIIIEDTTLNVLGQIGDKLYHSYSKTDGKLLNSTMNKGQGPDESIAPRNAVSDINGGIWIYDIPTTKFKHYNNEMKVIEEFLMTKHFLVSNSVWPVNNGRCLVLGAEGRGNNCVRTYRLLDTDSSSVISVYNKLNGPFIDNPPMATVLEFNEISPDGKHVAALSRYGVAAEFFDIDGDSIKQTVAELIIPQEFIEKNGIIQLPDDFDKLFRGFTSVCTTNEHVYGALNGTKGASQPSHICIWDWKGNPVRIIKTDACVANMAVDTKTNTLYAVVYTPEQQERQFAKLKLQ